MGDNINGYFKKYFLYYIYTSDTIYFVIKSFSLKEL